MTPTLAEANDLKAACGIVVLELLNDGPEGQTLCGADGETVVDGRHVPTGGDVLVELAATASARTPTWGRRWPWISRLASASTQS